ncbi:acylneuraminate cytidylyltransferase [Candidatus Poribacteria bacterium]|nr:acylneuraminate cytidylyltransferase [Candidatus Poribacteria bacterium]
MRLLAIDIEQDTEVEKMKKLDVLSIIPARSGSKGLPKKNLRECAGKPLIQWTVEASLNSKYIKQTMVSTDCSEIQEIAIDLGASAPKLRRTELSQDNSSMIDVVNDALRWTDVNFDILCLLQPTSPLRTTNHIDEAILMYERFQRSDDETLISVKKIDNKYLWMLGFNESSGYLSPLHEFDFSNPRRQKLPECYYPNGAIYITNVKRIDTFYSDKIIPFFMDEESSVDIDTERDLTIANNILLKKMMVA